MPDTVAFVGLGRMGYGMAQNLVAAGFRVRVWNRTTAKAEGLGAEVCTTPRQAATGAKFLVSMLADDRSVESIVWGRGATARDAPESEPLGALGALANGGIHVGMSTISTALARRLVEAHAAHGEGYVSAPVFGRPEAAANKMLWIVPGGDKPTLDACAPIFAALGRGTFPMDSAPQATLAKLIGNFLIAATIEAVGEATTLGEKGGIDPTRLVEMLSGTLFGSPVFDGYGARIAATAFEPAGFAMELGLKDVTLALRAGEELRVPLPLAALARDHILEALARGRGHFDWGGFASVIRESAGLPPTR